MTFSKHSAILSSFGKEYVKSGKLDAKYHKYLYEAFDLRQVGDYEPREQITEKTANKIISNAEEFLSEANKIIKS